MPLQSLRAVRCVDLLRCAASLHAEDIVETLSKLVEGCLLLLGLVLAADGNCYDNLFVLHLSLGQK